MEEEKETVELTDEQKMDKVENTLISEGILIPASDLVHYMTRNASYMRLINSQEFKDSGISLEVILDDEFIKEQFEANGRTAEMMRFVTEKIVPMMQEVVKENPINIEFDEDKQPELEGLTIEKEDVKDD